jgi:hypothetical protein
MDKNTNFLIGDKTCGNNRLDQRLKDQKGIGFIAPYNQNRRKHRTQDSRKLRQYRRQCKAERLFA